METALLVLTLVFGFYMTWNIGANDVANAMGTSVGSKALTLKKAVILAAILEFAGAFLVGSDVSETIQSGILDLSAFAFNPTILAIGMISALLGTGIWLQLASYFGWPVSTTHSIIGALFGFGLVIAGPATIHWSKISYIAISWILSPLIGATISYLIFIVIQRKILFSATPLRATRKLAPIFIFFSFFVFGLGLFAGGLKRLHLNFTFTQALGLSVLLGILTALFSGLFFKNRVKASTEDEVEKQQVDYQLLRGLNKSIKHLRRAKTRAIGELHVDVNSMLKKLSLAAHNAKKQMSLQVTSQQHNQVEKTFGYLQILSACFVAFAHGANDVANAIGPMAAILAIIKHKTVEAAAQTPLWLLALGGAGIVVGLMTWGWRVIETIGKKITDLTPTRGFAAEISAATTILLASKLGLPISTTHTLIGAVLGVGLARGIGALNLGVLKDIAAAWIITIPAGAVFTLITYFILKPIFI